MPVTALFDGQCAICRATERTVRALDWRGRVTFVDAQDEAARSAHCPGLDRAAALGQIHVLDERGVVFAGFLGTRRLLRELPLGLPLWALLHLPGMTWLGARVYRWVARRRYAVNRWLGGPACLTDTCRPG